jgi:inner membrane protein
MHRTHLVFAIFCSLIFLKLSYLDAGWMFFLLAGAGGLFVDIDIPKSWVGRKSGVVSEILKIVFGHRGFIHSVWMGLVISFGLYLVLGMESTGFLLGYFSHLFLDGFTKQGVYLFYPIKWRTSGWLKSGGVVDWGLFFVFLVLCVLMLVL